MLINRRTFTTKRGKLEEAVALLIEAQALIPDQPVRITTAEFGPFDTLVMDFDFATLADYERFWTGFFERPEFAETLARWYELIEPGGSNELWRVAEVVRSKNDK